MTYIVLMLLLVLTPLTLGHAWAARRTRPVSANPLDAFLIAVASVGVWFALSVWARRYSDTDRAGWAAAEWWAQSGKWFVFGAVGLFFLGVAFHGEKPPHTGRRVALCSAAVLLLVWITVWRTIPICAFLPSVVARDASGCIRQTVPYTCGPVSLVNLLELYGMRDPPPTERDLTRLAGTTYEGTTMSGLIRAARARGLKVVACRRMTLDELQRQGLPAVVFIKAAGPSVRHAVLFMGVRGNRVGCLDPDRGPIAIPRHVFEATHYGKSLVLGKP